MMKRVFITLSILILSAAMAWAGGPQTPLAFPDIQGTVGIANGGTGQTASSAALAALGGLSAFTPVAVASGGTGVTSITPVWTNMTLVNSWEWFDNGFNGTASPSFWKDPMGIVHLRGNLKAGTSGTQFTTLPAGYRPLKHLGIPVFTGASGFTIGNVQILNTGACYATGDNTSVDLSGISFPGEQ